MQQHGRKKDTYDGAQPSGNATMCLNLLKMSVLCQKTDWQNYAVAMLTQLQTAAEQYTQSFARWAAALLRIARPYTEVAVIGPDAAAIAAQIQAHYLPNLLLMAATTPNPAYPLLAQKTAPDPALTYIYVCQNYTCQRPVNTLDEFWALLQA